MSYYFLSAFSYTIYIYSITTRRDIFFSKYKLFHQYNSKCISNVFYFTYMCHACFISVHFQKKFSLNKRNDVSKGSLCTLPAFTENHTVIRIPHKFVPSACQFPAQFIQHVWKPYP